jgi:hypothetical protein
MIVSLMPEEFHLTVEIKNGAPVLLDDFTTSFRALADEYEAYVSDHYHEEDGGHGGNVQLYIEEIRPGSIIATLVAMAPYALPFVENAKTILGYAKFLKSAYDWFSGHSKEKPDLTKRDLENLSKIVEPVAKDSAAQVNISGNQNQTVIYNIHLDSKDANACQNIVRREIEAMREPQKRDHEKVLMYFYQARDDVHSDKGDRAKIESIGPAPVKVTFADEHLKARALNVEHGPFKSAYVVDVAVETIEGRPALYRVTAIHDIFNRVGTAP